MTIKVKVEQNDKIHLFSMPILLNKIKKKKERSVGNNVVTQCGSEYSARNA